MPLMQLSIDTSSDNASLSLADGDRVYFEINWYSGQNHTVELLPRLVYLIKQHGISVKTISAIFVARGPGSFNGLRVGISTAKGLAFSLGIPVVGISTLSLAAYQHAYSSLPVCPVFDARRGEIATAIYQMKAGKWCQVMSDNLSTPEALCSQITGQTIFCGDMTANISGKLRDGLGDRAIIPPPAFRLRRGAFLIELGQRELAAGKASDPATLQPLYLRSPAITKPRKGRLQ